MPDEKSIFDCIMSLQDSYNELLTSEIDDYSAFVDAFLTLTGVDAETDDIAQMKENRVLVLPEGVQAGKIIPDLPIDIDTDGTPSGDLLIFGSQQQLHHNW